MRGQTCALLAARRVSAAAELKQTNAVTRSSSGQRSPRVRIGVVTLRDVLLVVLLPWREGINV